VLHPNKRTNHDEDLQKCWSQKKVKHQAESREDQEEKRQDFGAVEPKESCHTSHTDTNEK